MNLLSRIFRSTPSLRTRVVVATAIGAAIPVLIVGAVVWVGITNDRKERLDRRLDEAAGFAIPFLPRGIEQIPPSPDDQDAIITVRGFLSREKDTPTIKAQEVTVPDLSDGPTGPVVISLPSTRCTPPVVEQLKDVLSTHPGMTEVQLKLLARTSTTVLRLDERLRVTATPALFADLKQLLGPGCLSG